MRFIRFSVIVLFCAACNMLSAQKVEYVDLGLSVKWCTVNTGITAERPYGWYYRWPDAMALKTTDGSRMASKAEWNELLEFCTWKWTKQNGIEGYLVTSNIKGYKNKSIFLPAAGWLQDGKLMQTGTYASYWASTPGVQPDNESAYGFNFQRGTTEWHSENRESEQSVRMVMPLNGNELTKLSIDRKALSMEQGTTARLNVSMQGGKRNVNSASIWKSSDENVVFVMDDGLIVAVTPGNCTLTVQAYGKSAECAVTVKPHDVEFVDLGLGVLWATCNIGAAKPSDAGNYYAWAEIEPKEFYSWSDYRYCSFGQQNGMDKYTAQGMSHQYLKADNLERLEPMDDIASVLSGGKWHMPTVDDIKELIMNCDYDTAIIQGVEGLRFTSKVPGYEGKSIFIPYAGCINGNEPKDKGRQFYIWSATAGNGNRGVYMNTRDSRMGGFYDMSMIDLIENMPERDVYPNIDNAESRFVGMNVRPVMSLGSEMFTSLSFPDEHLDMHYGQLKQVEVKMMPANRPVKDMNVTWSSSDPDIAEVAGGYLTAIGKGNCIITAESGGFKAEMTVSVSLPEPEPVDLGLSVMWASANLGASQPDESGAYLMWGETSPKTVPYTGDKYKFGQYTNATSKYNYYTASWGGSDYPLDYKETLDPEDDAVQVLLGEGWRMPLADELWELRTKCTWEPVITVLDSNEFYVDRRTLGYVITSNVPGYEDRSIYLPAAGYIGDYMHDSDPVVNKGHAYYWTSTVGQSLGNSGRRYNGLTIRPVKELPKSENRKKAEPDPVKPLKHNAQVDLGLSVLWADCNVGAEKPEEVGVRFAWGETKEKTYYSTTNYKYMTAYKDVNKWWYSKYAIKKNDNDPFEDGKTRLELQDDAARANWGGSWRMPTKEEYKELYEKCEWKEDSLNGVKGYRITSKVPGYTDKSIFLPYNSSFGEMSLFSDPSDGFYMTSDLSSRYPDRCVVLEFSEYEFGTSDEINLDFGETVSVLGGTKMSNVHIPSRDRANGCSVRAVCAKGKM